MANSVYPNETAHIQPSDMDLDCLQMCLVYRAEKSNKEIEYTYQMVHCFLSVSLMTRETNQITLLQDLSFDMRKCYLQVNS